MIGRFASCSFLPRLGLSRLSDLVIASPCSDVCTCVHAALQMAQQARQVLAACEKAPTDAVAVQYDSRNPFDVCSITFTPIYRGNKCAAFDYRVCSATWL